MISRLTPIVDKLKTDTTRRAQFAHAAYALGIARYHLSGKASTFSTKLSAVGALRTYFAAEAELTAAGEEVREPLLGRALGRFYLGHILYNGGDFPKAKDALTEYLADVAAAGPQRVLNMPDGFLGKKISEAERKASRFKSRACSGEAQADAHTMLAMISEHLDGAEGLRSIALPHLQAQLGEGGGHRAVLGGPRATRALCVHVAGVCQSRRERRPKEGGAPKPRANLQGARGPTPDASPRGLVSVRHIHVARVSSTWLELLTCPRGRSWTSPS